MNIWKAISKGDVDKVESFLAEGISTNSPNKKGETLLQVACQEGQEDIVRLLLEQGARQGEKLKINQSDNKLGRNALFYAIESNSPEIVELLLEHNIEANKTDKDGYLPLHFALSLYEDDQIASKLIPKTQKLDQANKEGLTPLHFAAGHANMNIIDDLVKNGANPNAKDKKGNTPIFMASSSSSALNAINLLLKSGADINATNDDDDTLLHWAAREGDQQLTRFLLEKGANPNLLNKHEESPLKIAFLTAKDKVVELLRDKTEDKSFLKEIEDVGEGGEKGDSTGEGKRKSGVDEEEEKEERKGKSKETKQKELDRIKRRKKGGKKNEKQEQQDLKDFLEENELGKFYDTFLSNGIKSLETAFDLGIKDLKKFGISGKEELERIIAALEDEAERKEDDISFLDHQTQNEINQRLRERRSGGAKRGEGEEKPKWSILIILFLVVLAVFVLPFFSAGGRG
eukprot:TRINITY_DN4539_c0_g1_i1.p1 TRINITY_DN4539_c0_g1~~TRINITY_DN4539_c0_g1_i1.p1  ORF type:complete len:459 (-),score=162.22 TRINITY_DN4539_c0_g1_i1:94-1470(-)